MARMVTYWFKRALLVCFFLPALVQPALVQPALAQSAGTTIGSVARSLAQDPIFVDPAATPTLSASESAELRQKIAGSGAGPVYIAVLSETARNEAGGSTAEVVRRLGQTLRRRGTYAVVIGTELRAASTSFAVGVVPGIATEVVSRDAGKGLATVLLDFIDRLGQEATAARGSGNPASTGAANPAPEAPAPVQEERRTGLGIFPIVFLVGGGGVAAVYYARRKRQRLERERLQLEEVKKLALDDLVGLGEDLKSVDIDVEMADVDPGAKQDYASALDSYQIATDNLDKARRPQDLKVVTSALEQGRYAMASAKARLAGQPPPERSAPCFFDPRHGPSTEQIDWAPEGGTPRPVPACSADATRIRDGQQPLTRQISVNGKQTPYWNAPAYYGPWAGGYFGGYGMLEGMMIGSLMSGGFGGGYGFSGDFDDDRFDQGTSGEGGDVGGGGGGFPLIPLLGGSPVFLILFVVGNLILRSRGQGFGTGGVPSSSGESPPAPPPPSLPSPALEAGLAAIRAHDPAFDVPGLLDEVAGIHGLVNRSWVELDPQAARSVLGETLFNERKQALEAKVARSERPFADDLHIGRSDLMAASTDPATATETVVVRIHAYARSYDLDAEGSLLAGDPALRLWSEDWHLSRSTSEVTRRAAGTSQVCPRCGAPLSLRDDGTCSFCQAQVAAGASGWRVERIDPVL